MHKTFSENASAINLADFDEEAGLIRNVKLLGEESDNGRLYPRSTRSKAASKYVGRQVYVDHPRPSERGEDRSVDRLAGVIESATDRPGGIYGTIRLFKESPFFKRITEIIRKASSAIGCSHIASGESHFRDDGIEVVDEITQVESVDLVTKPATTRGLFESANAGDPEYLKATITRAIEVVQGVRDGARDLKLVFIEDIALKALASLDKLQREANEPNFIGGEFLTVKIVADVIAGVSQCLLGDEAVRESTKALEICTGNRLSDAELQRSQAVDQQDGLQQSSDADDSQMSESRCNDPNYIDYLEQYGVDDYETRFWKAAKSPRRN